MSSTFGSAYESRSSADHRAYYDAWAKTYDEDFAERERYDYPARIAAVYRALAVDADVPVADIGCGTGLLGRALTAVAPGIGVHGFDISPGMLEVAACTGAYEAVVEVDLAASTLTVPATFGAVVSAGTFTVGHLGPDVLPTIVTFGRPSALFVLGVNSQHFIDAGFAAALDDLCARGLITAWQVIRVPIFGESASDDPMRVGCVVAFRRSR